MRTLEEIAALGVQGTRTRRVRSQLSYAIQTGKVTRKPCEVCGKARVVGHHHDYGRPLDVIWLCSPDHGSVHVLINGGTIIDRVKRQAPQRIRRPSRGKLVLIMVQMTANEREEIREAAAVARLGVSPYILEAGLEELRRDCRGSENGHKLLR